MTPLCLQEKEVLVRKTVGEKVQEFSVPYYKRVKSVKKKGEGKKCLRENLRKLRFCRKW